MHAPVIRGKVRLPNRPAGAPSSVIYCENKVHAGGLYSSRYIAPLEPVGAQPANTFAVLDAVFVFHVVCGDVARRFNAALWYVEPKGRFDPLNGMFWLITLSYFICSV